MYFLRAKIRFDKNFYSINERRFEEMHDTYKKYFSPYKKIVYELIRENKDKKAVFKEYVISRIGAQAGLRPYILRKIEKHLANSNPL